MDVLQIRGDRIEADRPVLTHCLSSRSTASVPVDACTE
ncbi:hypothetical protein HMPREF1129_1291 [Actinomyces naeslundii str. Howell 279]|uniref:Uncharacterized protein n=1 Tax=Actinomyces naeslundii (strain ATCC 12104 / DSM 43013 / CCUG 2238 / JCM 8349 / NCTC 10301 / Howell 279) TaxID=1115803 RepID=J3JLM1_ACTNH|nr:hypothetical protein HMPREF1129_1291 [Actinomyces naeslundii str. Howell 279]